MAALKGHNELHLSMATVQEVMKEWLAASWPNEAGKVTGLTFDGARSVFVVALEDLPAPIPVAPVTPVPDAPNPA